jgi:hypothetical protein
MSSVLKSSATCRSLYGSAAGDWCFVDSPAGLIPPPWFGSMRYLGDPDDAFTRLYGKIAGPACSRAKIPAQRLLAGLAGTGQQAASLYVRQQSRPRLTCEAWRRVTALLFAWTEWPDKPVDEAAVRAFLAGCAELPVREALP